MWLESAREIYSAENDPHLAITFGCWRLGIVDPVVIATFGMVYRGCYPEAVDKKLNDDHLSTMFLLLYESMVQHGRA